MKKLVTAVFIAVLAAFGGSASGQGTATKKIKVGVTMPKADHGWMGGANWWAKKAMDDWKKKDPNVDFVFKTWRRHQAGGGRRGHARAGRQRAGGVPLRVRPAHARGREGVWKGRVRRGP